MHEVRVRVNSASDFFETGFYWLPNHRIERLQVYNCFPRFAAGEHEYMSNTNYMPLVKNDIKSENQKQVVLVFLYNNISF